MLTVNDVCLQVQADTDRGRHENTSERLGSCFGLFYDVEMIRCRMGKGVNRGSLLNLTSPK